MIGNPRDGGVGATWEWDIKINFMTFVEVELENWLITHFNKEG